MKTLIFSVLATVLAFQAHAAMQTRCGWLSNPTPGNLWLDDTQGEWILATQGAGGSNVKGEWPALNQTKGYWIVPKGAQQDYYGYGCACVTGTFDNDQKLMLTITKSKVKPIAACRKDPALAKQEPSFN